MKAIMVMFDSLNRHMLPVYGCDWTHTPNFRRLAERSATFDNSYVCSMPCMPARRDLHTGRPNFLHRSWGPLEPFDDSIPEMLKENGVHTHLASDHYHYWEEGGATYHTRYSTWEFFRGQEGDPWKGQVAPPRIPEEVVTPRHGAAWQQDWANRGFMRSEEQQPQAKTFACGLDYIRRNHRDDNWFLQIETFDPHEPFFTQRKYKDLYADHYRSYRGGHFDWPPYCRVNESPAEVDHCRHEYAALLSMCDSRLGDVLDAMDEFDLWQDTMLVVWTDHGFLLGEHDCWAKCWMPFYNEVAHTPFFVWDPRCRVSGTRRSSLVQPSIDLGPTLLEYFGLDPTPDMLGRPLRDVVASDVPVRDAAFFGMHGGHVNVNDGRYVYMRGPARADNQPLNNYTLMPAHMRRTFSVDELRDNIELSAPFPFTKGCQTMRINAGKSSWIQPNAREKLPTLLFDLHEDPSQERPLDDADIERRMTELLISLLREADAPDEQYERLGLRRGQ
ncbi:MAG: sulfatase [Armatimonadetes bacterium CG2_30_59_28]|nr:sulfatase [Armatimonadota bacterium]OIO98110.1 MAG: sulfatase [Armatimonadetes bacterium CG2_30_59_28]PIU63584.1 MAG: sulfatase [Armatimonadetes bacterium CG07_land_8_20_14_0_80_59_28]PIX42504.1 MAG: sulfatase [Armatimonadetes bacterium CG_4_8_14_3_um_filter_58_9]PIY47514.1 MAG: sulfatase [Armatimonadetes bacterium CG_4_10_14_3_um_filter_59_10]PJB62898.1 MAG: sulfatase [Armatimonadetes bacterium CG_4_9_14_3_um_filter_58_7]